MLSLPKLLVAAIILGFATPLSAAEIRVDDGQRVITLPDAPKRVVVLEFSFADALASVNVSPVGVADDNDEKRLPSEVRAIIGKWTSVGTRGQPSIEAIANLKPDLIVADLDRHRAVYDQLSAIAPTMLLASRGENYEGSLKSAAKIAEALGKTTEMNARLEKHRAIMAEFASKVPDGASMMFGASREDSFSAHGPESYDGSVLLSLGIKVPEVQGKGNDAYNFVSIEQLLALNPDYLLVGHYRRPSIVDKWSKEPLWSALKASKGKVYAVDENVWARNRGIIAAEKIASDTLAILDGSYKSAE